MGVEMKESWLVQRLNPPIEGTGPLANVSEVFSFGGGLRNGGLREEAMRLLRPIFSFDYMGSAEFEFGAVPKALSALSQAELATFELVVPEGTIWGICRSEHKEEIKNRLTEWAREPYVPMKGALHLHRALTGDDAEWCRVRGWLELDNGFMFFIDRTMFERMVDLFGGELP